MAGENDNRIGVLIVNTGTPDAPTPEAVGRYLSQFLMDPCIAPMNRVLWWFILQCFIVPKRSKISSEKYKKIWTPQGSPQELALSALEKTLNNRYFSEGYPLSVVHGMSYGSPSCSSSLEILKNKGCRHIVVLPLYPQSAFCTTGAVKGVITRALQEISFNVEYSIIDNYHDNSLYLNAIASSIRDAGFDSQAGDEVLFSLHSAPIVDIEHGDTYQDQVNESCRQIASLLGIGPESWTISYQSRFDKGRRWLTPFTTDVLSRLAEHIKGRLFFVSPGFSVDCLETLYEVPYEFKPLYMRRRKCLNLSYEDDSFIYVPCLNSSYVHRDVLYDVLSSYVKIPSRS